MPLEVWIFRFPSTLGIYRPGQPGCLWGETLEELMEVASAHGREVHRIDEIAPEMMAMAQRVIREE